jgi:surfeit locus 1 family protein
MSRRWRYALLVLAPAFALVCLRLGLWQLSRLRQRQEANAQALAARQLPVIDLDTGSGGETLENRRVRLQGRYDAARAIILRNFVMQGAPGVRVAMPLRPAQGDTATVVLRGFLPAADGGTADLAALPDTGLVVVEGLAFALPATPDSGGRLEDRGRVTYRRLDRGALGRIVPYPLRGIYVMEQGAGPVGGGMLRVEPPSLDEGPHLSYALQWFGFGTIALVVAGMLLFRKERSGGAP